MTTDPQFVVGLLVAVNVVLLLGVLGLVRSRRELISLRASSTEQRITASLAENRANSLEAEVATLNKELCLLYTSDAADE